MARLRRTSSVLETARQRLAGLKSITPAPDFGAALTVAGFEAAITDVNGELSSYNQNTAALDDQQNRLETKEATLNDLNKRMLSAAEAHFGPDSSEYEAVGGTRLSERKRPTPKAPGGGTPPPTP